MTEKPQNNSSMIPSVTSRKLESAWQNVLGNYGDVRTHEDFVNLALAEKNLPFASQQYRKMLELNAMDEVAIKMRDKIINLATLTFSMPARQVSKKTSLLRKIFILFVSMIFVILLFSFISLSMR